MPGIGGPLGVYKVWDPAPDLPEPLIEGIFFVHKTNLPKIEEHWLIKGLGVLGFIVGSAWSLCGFRGPMGP